MDAMRDVLRGSLGRSLSGIREEDRLAAAWTVACGCAMADHGRIAGYEAGVLRIEVTDQVWMRQMVALGSVLQREIASIAGLPVRKIEFELEKGLNTGSQRSSRDGGQDRPRIARINTD
jgi:hypothetical protein